MKALARKRIWALAAAAAMLRNHSAARTRKQEPYRFKNKAAFAGILQLRYLLLPYIYSEYMKAALRDGMYCMPLAFAFPDDDFARQVEDEVMIGESLLIAPVYEQNARGRYVYLPEEMLQLKHKITNQGVLNLGIGNNCVFYPAVMALFHERQPTTLVRIEFR